MRDIKFRAWDGKKMLMFDSWTFYTDGPTTTIAFWLKNKKRYRPDLDGSSSPIMQYTGLLDKNGKEIYEGDILDIGFKNSENNLDRLYVVNYMKMFARYSLFDQKTNGCNDIIDFDEDEGFAGDMLVVGNIYETPSYPLLALDKAHAS